jgi:LysM repeat protein
VLVVVPNASKEPSQETFYHEVQQGETPYSVARKYGKTTKELMELNSNLTDTISQGQKIKIR